MGVVANRPGNEAATLLLIGHGGRRSFVPIARGFLQRRTPGGGPGPLAWFVRSHRGSALRLYLLAHALASAPPYDIALPARTWAAALGLPARASSRVSVSSSIGWLEQHRLLRSRRDGRLRRIWLLDETGSGDDYQHGGEATRQADYFKLPYHFWFEGWSERLELPAIVVLLIGLSLRQPFKLPYDRGAEWYGISRDTIRRGLHQLRTHELLTVRSAWRATSRSPTGAAEERRYTLTGSFAAAHRRARPAAPTQLAPAD